MDQDAQRAMKQGTVIVPMLSIRRGTRAIAFYEAAFGAEELYRVESADGTVVAQMAIEGAEFWLADESPDDLNYSPESLGGGAVRMLLIVADPDAAFRRAVAAGAAEVWSVRNEHGWRVGRIVDPFGHHWEIGRPLAETP
jgi:PhnB protein